MNMDTREQNQVSQLEAALLQQAQSLAREQQAQALAARARMEAELAEKLRLEEEREILAVKAEAETLVRRQSQAAETRLAAELDRLRWALTEATLSQVRLEFQDLVDDDSRYLPLLEDWLAAAARTLPPGDVVVSVRAQDLPRLEADWDAMLARAAPGRQVARSVLGFDSLGGLRVRLADGRAQCDQTFEARAERMAQDLAQVAMERLFASAPDLGQLVHG
jgi:V/A-type H+/Na+-transporting ATPase subunit E